MEPCADDAAEPKHVLIVDDEPLVRQLLVRVLGRRGFASLEAKDGSDAMNLVERHREMIGAVLADVRMPKVDGIKLARYLALSHPDLPVALMSTDFDPSELEGLDNVKHWLLKPFGNDLLAATVGALLADC